MDSAGPTTLTHFEPVAAHIRAANDAMTTTNGIHTPSYGGVVSTGAEWDFTASPNSARNRSASRSPHRAANDHRSVSTPMSPPGDPSAAVSGSTASASAGNFGARSTPSEEARNYVGRSVTASQQATAQQNSTKGSSPRTGASPGQKQSSTSAPPQAPASSQQSQSQSTGAGGSSRRRQYRQVGDWVSQKTLGQGSMGKVKLGVNVNTHERCAVKIVPRVREDHKSQTDSSGRNKDESKEIRTVREASISSLSHHPYICGMRDFLVHQNHYYMVFEYIDGGQMLDYIIAHGRLRERAARKFARQIGSALDYCHHNNIVHRDSKIENILISNNGNIKIIDFGSSNLYSPHRHLSTFCGSLYFAAPESLNAKLYTGPEVDIWSFGIVLYVSVCGKVPFDDQSMPASHAKIKRGLAEYPAWLSSDCKASLQRMSNTNPQERATLAEVLSHPWMTKGYEGRPDSHSIVREPLRADEVDMEVIKRMQGFTFGTPEEIYDNSQRISNSEQYLRTAAAWEATRERRRSSANGTMGSMNNDGESPKKKRFSGFDSKKKLFKEEKKPDEIQAAVKEPSDPSSGFDPSISIYFLAREKKEREKVYGASHFASSKVSLEGQTSTMNYEQSLASVPEPPSAHASTFDTKAATNATVRDAGTAASARRRPDESGSSAPPATAVMSHPAADAARSNIADVPIAHRRGATTPQVPSPSAPSTPAAPLSAPMVATPPSAALAEDEHAEGVPIPAATATPASGAGASAGAITTAMAGTTLYGRETGVSSNPATVVQATTSEWPVPLGIIQDKSGGIRPIGAPESDEIEPADVANIDVKSVYLKGLFSVSTTSTKSARTLSRDISHVSDRVGIKYRPIRGGFECIHVPSIDLASVVHGDEARSQSHVPQTDSGPLENSPSKNKLTFKQNAASSSSTQQRGDSPAPAGLGTSSVGAGSDGVAPGSSGTVGMSDNASVPSRKSDIIDDDPWGTMHGANSPSCVRFEVFVVKVPWLPLHGIQFRRVGGDGWQYQQSAKTISREMRS